MLTFRVLTSVTPNLPYAYNMSGTHMILHVYGSLTDTRDVSLSMRNIFPFKWYTSCVTFWHRQPHSDLSFMKYLSILNST